jgi:hypothetical protein
MAHASSSNFGPFLEKRGYMPMPEQVKCHFVFDNYLACISFFANVFL